MQRQPTEAERKVDVISGYLEKFGTIDGRVLTPQLYQVYIEALQNFDLRQIEKGLNRYLQTGERWPWPGTLAQYCEEEI